MTTRAKYIVELFKEGKSVFLLSRMYDDLAQPDIEGILRLELKRKPGVANFHGRAANPKRKDWP